MKVGEQVDKKETIKNIINNNDGIAKTADFVSEGLSNYDVANLCKEGYIERIRHGYYQLAEQEDIKEEQVLASLLPESVVCVESALFYYGYSDFSPRQWSIAVPRTFSRTRLHIDSLATKVYFVQPTLFEISRSFFADSSYMLSFSVLCSCVCSRLISPSVSSWHKQDNTLMHQSPGHIQRRTPYNF